MTDINELENKEPNTLTDEQNERLNVYADELARLLNDGIENKNPITVKTLLISMILLAKEPDETFLLAEKASEWMMDIKFEGSIGEAIELFLKNKNGE